MQQGRRRRRKHPESLRHPNRPAWGTLESGGARERGPPTEGARGATL